MLHVIPTAQDIAMIDEVAELFDHEALQNLGSSELIEIFSELDDTDPLFSNDEEGNTSNATTNCAEEDSQTEGEDNYEESTTSVDEGVHAQMAGEPPCQTPSLLIPTLQVPQTLEQGDESSETKKRKLQAPLVPCITPNFQPLLPLFQPSLLAMMAKLPQSSSAPTNLLQQVKQEDPVSCLSSKKALQREQKQIRMMKNRESATKSRIKRKNALVGLESEVDHLKGQIQKLNEELAAVKAENSSLKSHNTFLQSLLSNSSSVSPAAVANSYRVGSCQTTKSEEVEGSAKSSSGGGGAGSVALFAMGLFCFLFVSLSPDEPEIDQKPLSRAAGRVLLFAASPHASQSRASLTFGWTKLLPFLALLWPAMELVFAVLLVVVLAQTFRGSFHGIRSYFCLPVYHKKAA